MKALSLAALVLGMSISPAVRSEEALTGYSPPHVVDYTGGRVPEYAHLETRTNTKVIEWGIGVLGVTYGLTVLYAMGTCGAQMDCRSGSAALYVPVIGPFITAPQAPTSGGQALSVFDGVVQTAGLGLVAAGVLMPRSVVVWQDPDMALRVTPTLGPGTAGLSVSLASM